jgi:hypothetical protein
MFYTVPGQGDPVRGAEINMSHHEKFAWGSLLASLLGWSLLTMRMTHDWSVVDVGPGHMIWTYVAVVILMVVTHAVLAGVLGVRSEAPVLKDERDLAIEARAERFGGTVVLVAINVLIIHALLEAAYAGHALPRIDLGALPVMFYVLLSVLFLGHVVSQGATIWQYRA